MNTEALISITFRLAYMQAITCGAGAESIERAIQATHKQGRLTDEDYRKLMGAVVKASEHDDLLKKIIDQHKGDTP